jgi:nucleoside phosphorylase
MKNIRGPLIDVAVLAALAEEYAEVLRVLHAEATYCGTCRYGDRESELFRLPFAARDGRTGSYTIAASSDFQMNGDRMAQFATDFFRDARPHAAILLGIAASVKVNNAPLGDAMVADHIFSYANVAAVGDKQSFRKAGYPVSAALRRAAEGITTRSDDYLAWRRRCASEILADVAELNKNRRADQHAVVPAALEPPMLNTATLASATFLLRSAEFRDALVELVDEKIEWAEMEAFGFMEAAHVHDVKAIVIKGISDLGDENKTTIERETHGFFRLYAIGNATRAAVATLALGPLEPLEVNRVRFDLTRSHVFTQQFDLHANAGEHVIGFPRLVSTDGTVVAMTVSIAAYAQDGRALQPRRAAHTIDAGQRGQPRASNDRDAEWRLAVDDWPHPIVIGAAFLFAERVARIIVTVNSRFESAKTIEWRSEGTP